MATLLDLKQEYSQSSRLEILIVVGITFFERAILLAPVIVVGRIVDLVASEQSSEISPLLWLLAGFGIIQVLLWPIRERFVASVIQRIVLKRSVRLTEKVFEKDYDVFASSRVGYVTKVVERALEGFERLSVVLLTQALPALASVLLVLAYFVFLLPLGTLALLAGAVLYLGLSLVILRWRRAFLDDVNDAEDDIADSFAVTFLAARSIKSSGLAKSALQPLATTYGSYALAARDLAFASGVLASAQSAITLLVTISAILAGVYWLDVSDSFSAGDFVVVFAYVGVFMANLAMAWKVREAVDEYEADASALGKITDLKAARIADGSKVEGDPSILTIGKGRLPAPSGLQIDTSVKLEQGHLVSIIGASGSGKTLLLQMLAGVKSSEKAILVNEEKLDDLTASSVTDTCGYLWQEPQFLFGSFEEGVFFRSLSAAEKERALNIAENLGIESLVNFDSRDFRADSLSGGEKKRLALLRFLVEPKPILLLDEPTSELDARSASAVVNILQDLKANHLAIVATHDGNIRDISDEVYEIKDRKLIRSA